jgi:hypothetical protein
MTFDTDDAERINDLIDGVLDAGYDETVLPTLSAITASTNSGLIADDLDELDKEVARLNEAGLTLEADNPILRNLMNDLGPVLDKNGVAIDDAGPDIQESGIESASTLTKNLALFDASVDDILRLNAVWNVPDPEAVNAAVGYVQSEAWAEQLAVYGPDVLETINNYAIVSIVNGQGSLTTARQLRQMVETLPAAVADNLMRTLQIQSYQSATAANQTANASILSGQVRIETFDDRICLSCVAEHGRIYPTGEKIIDHHQGRATAIPLVTGRDRVVGSGVDWFNSLPVARQRKIAGTANLRALQAGAVEFDDYRQRYDDPVFGKMQREASLVSILGSDGAQEFYSNG